MHKLGEAEVTSDAFLDIYNRTPGLIPHSLSSDGTRLTWIDLGTYHMYEGSYRQASRTAVSILGNSIGADYRPFYTTDLSVIDHLSPVPGDLIPSAFIYGVSRCGSTLLTRALARDRQILAFGESLIPNGLWRLSHENTLTHATDTITRLRKIVSLMGRNRGGSYRHLIFKLSSVELHAAQLLSEAFPDTPCLFMYREPAEVLVSHLKHPPGWADEMTTAWGKFLSGQDGPQTKTEFYAQVLRGYYSAALSRNSQGWKSLDYANLAPKHLPGILAAMGINANSVDLAAMAHCFQSYSKSPYKNARFESDQKMKQGTGSDEVPNLVAEHLTALYEASAQVPQNLRFDTVERENSAT